MTVRGTSGLALHDLRFRGQRIVYELSLQELFIAYNGYGGAAAFLFKPSVWRGHSVSVCWCHMREQKLCVVNNLDGSMGSCG